jgi:hypothetical protein
MDCPVASARASEAVPTDSMAISIYRLLPSPGFVRQASSATIKLAILQNVIAL